MKTPHETYRSVTAGRVLAISFFSAAMTLVGCQQQGPAEKAGQKIDQAAENAGQKIDQMTKEAGKKIESAKDAVADKTQTAEGYVDDSVITAKIKTGILNNNDLRSSLIDVTTSGGIVQLSGTAKSQQAAEQAVAMAKAQTGVKSVNSSLTVNAHSAGNP